MQFATRIACKWIVSVLRIAHKHDCEGLLALELLLEADQSELPDFKSLQGHYVDIGKAPQIPVRQHKSVEYDELLEGSWATRGVSHG